jgi:hypothetical protein
VFVKSNRLAVSFGLPFGVGLALFAEALITDVLGDRWLPALGLLQVFAIIAAIDQLGFNWSAFLPGGRAHEADGGGQRDHGRRLLRGRPAAAAARRARRPGDRHGGHHGRRARAAGVVRRRLFPGAPLLRETLRALVPTALGAGAVVLGGRGDAVAELVLFVAVVAAATWVLQGALLREAAATSRGAARPTASRRPARRSPRAPATADRGGPPGRSAAAPSRR